MEIKSEFPAVMVVDCRGPLCIVDDDESVRWSVMTLLQSMNFDAYAFSGGREFLESDLAHDCQCLISDVKMRKMSGFELLEAIKKLGLETPVIFISGHADERMRRQAISAGAVALLDKPFKDDLLLKIVEQAIGKNAAPSPGA